MKNYDTRVHNVSDFVEWEDRNQLLLSPDFQRRSVWSLQAKSYLIDTIIRGKPMPKLLITQEVKDRRNIRVVIDGQQRLRAILEFAKDGFSLSRAHNKELAGSKFSDLPEDDQTAFLKYEIGVDLLYDLPYNDILDIFARLNTYTVKLNNQELLNAKYVGFFKQSAYRLGYRYVEYLISGRVVTKAQVTRMVEAELTSDLLTALIEGIQTNKNIETLYKKYEDKFDAMEATEQKFDTVMRLISSIYPPADLANTNWSRVHLFYTLFTAIAHGHYKLNGAPEDLRPKATTKTIGRFRIALDDISAQYDLYTEEKGLAADIPRDYANFIQRSRRATTDTGARQERTRFLCSKLVEALG